MPELPEVETSLKGIEPFLKNGTIDHIEVRNGALRWPVSQEIYRLNNAKVKQLIRRGKYIVIVMNEGALLVHLGMSGNLRVVKPETPIKKHDHIDIVTNANHIIRFNDPRRFGCMLWADNWQSHALITNLGLEPLTEKFKGDFLYQAAKNRKTSIKQFIMDAGIVVGVGNIYANEALFLSGIHPKRAAGKISKQRMGSLAQNIKQVLNKAIEQGGTTLKDFMGSDGKPGYFKQSLSVYGRKGLPCIQCGELLKEIRQSNRATTFCPSCQH